MSDTERIMKQRRIMFNFRWMHDNNNLLKARTSQTGISRSIVHKKSAEISSQTATPKSQRENAWKHQRACLWTCGS